MQDPYPSVAPGMDEFHHLDRLFFRDALLDTTIDEANPTNFTTTPMTDFIKQEQMETPTQPQTKQTTHLGYASDTSNRSHTTDVDGSPHSVGLIRLDQKVEANAKTGRSTAGGKTSIYRGVTRTSKIGWGAKYSSKRITSTCKTQEEAARAYDAYLKEHVPAKYEKYANFCPTCDQFTNSLGLPNVKCICTCKKIDSSYQKQTSSPAESTATDSPPYSTPGSSAADELLAEFDDPYAIDNNSTYAQPPVSLAATMEPIYLDPVKTSHSLELPPELNLTSTSLPLMSTSTTYPAASTPLQNYSIQMMNVQRMEHMGLQTRPASVNEMLLSDASPVGCSRPHATFEEIYRSVEASARRKTPESLNQARVMVNTVGLVNSTNNAKMKLQIDLSIRTQFLSKYWRNDRKNIQCFPFCPEFGDYFQAKITNSKHKCKGVCRAAVEVDVLLYPGLDPNRLLLLAKCTSEQGRVIYAEKVLSAEHIELMQEKSVVGINQTKVLQNENNYQRLLVRFHPDVWKFEDELPKKRRQLENSTAPDPKYLFQVEAFYSMDPNWYKSVGSASSSLFEFESTRTLLRHKHRLHERQSVDLVSIDCVEKKKIRMAYEQNGAQTPLDDETIDCNLSEEDANEKDQEFVLHQTPRGKPQLKSTCAVPTTVTNDRTYCQAASSQTHSPHFILYAFSNFISALVLSPVFFIALVCFPFLPFIFPILARWMDSLARIDIARVNRYSVGGVQPKLLVSSATEQAAYWKRSISFARRSDFWGRIVYFAFTKLIIAVVVLIGSIGFSCLQLATICVPLVPLSMQSRGCSCIGVAIDLATSILGELEPKYPPTQEADLV